MPKRGILEIPVERVSQWLNVSRFMSGKELMNNFDEFLRLDWFDVSEEDEGWRREELPVAYSALWPRVCLNFTARSRRKLRPISGDVWFTAVVSIDEQPGEGLTPFFPHPLCVLFFRIHSAATSLLRIGSCKSISFREYPGFSAIRLHCASGYALVGRVWSSVVDFFVGQVRRTWRELGYRSISKYHTTLYRTDQKSSKFHGSYTSSIHLTIFDVAIVNVTISVNWSSIAARS